MEDSRCSHFLFHMYQLLDFCSPWNNVTSQFFVFYPVLTRIKIRLVNKWYQMLVNCMFMVEIWQGDEAARKIHIVLASNSLFLWYTVCEN